MDMPMTPFRIVVETDTSKLCLWGWNPKGRHYGACTCGRPIGHKGRCKCDSCDSTSTRPADWDVMGRDEANR